jgi:dienelactone hydrolase
MVNVGSMISLLSVFGLAQSAPSGSPFSVSVPKDVTQLWSGYDPRALSLDIEIKQAWTDGDVKLQRLYFTSEISGGVPARIYAITGVPRREGKVPGILHIHGGGQTASLDWVRYWTKRGYAAVSLDWCGEVATRADFAHWGAIKANMMKDGQDRTTSPSVRASPWFHWAGASRRALTVLEQLPDVDVTQLAIFGVSMGGTLTWVVAGSDARVKTAVPIYGCGWNTYPDVHSGGGYTHPVPPEIELWRATMEPETYARYITCPVLQLTATNDFHTHMDRSYDSLARVNAPTWQSLTPRYSHHLEPEQGKTLERWMESQLKTHTVWPRWPQLTTQILDRRIDAIVTPDRPMDVAAVSVFAAIGTRRPQTRFWRSVTVSREQDRWRGQLPVLSVDQPIRVVSNVTYVDGITLSSVESVIAPSVLSGLQITEAPTMLIDDFSKGVEDWTYGPAYTDPNIDWRYLMRSEGAAVGIGALSLNPVGWTGRPVQYTFGTYKVNDPGYAPPEGARLGFAVRSSPPSRLELHALFDHWGPQSREYTASVPLKETSDWQECVIDASDCVAKDGAKLRAFQGLDRIDFVGQSPQGQMPVFAQVRWLTSSNPHQVSGSGS